MCQHEVTILHDGGFAEKTTAGSLITGCHSRRCGRGTYSIFTKQISIYSENRTLFSITSLNYSLVNTSFM